jgi:hypothetical protein
MIVTEFLDVLRSFLRSEVENVRRFEMPWRRRLWLYRHGFLSSKDTLWELTRDTVDQYLSDLEYRAVGRINGEANAGLKNKALFHLIVSSTHDHLVPDVYGLVRDGDVVTIEQFGGGGSIDRLVELLGNGPVVAKPVTAAKGDDVRILNREDGQVHVNGQPVEEETLLGVLGDDRDLLLMEHVGQADYAATIFPGATNTLRLLTMIDPETGEPFIASGVHRFGTRSSSHIDNWSAGGVSAGIDLETGELEGVVSSPTDDSNETGRLKAHPDTGARIAGVELPSWDRIKETVLDLAATYSWLWPHVGWDIIVRDDRGAVTVLEGDHGSIDADLQAHGPLLADDRVRRFYEHHGVLSSERGVLPT